MQFSARSRGTAGATQCHPFFMKMASPRHRERERRSRRRRPTPHPKKSQKGKHETPTLPRRPARSRVHRRRHSTAPVLPLVPGLARPRGAAVGALTREGTQHGGRSRRARVADALGAKHARQTPDRGGAGRPRPGRVDGPGADRCRPDGAHALGKRDRTKASDQPTRVGAVSNCNGLLACKPRMAWPQRTKHPFCRSGARMPGAPRVGSAVGPNGDFRGARP